MKEEKVSSKVSEKVIVCDEKIIRFSIAGILLLAMIFTFSAIPISNLLTVWIFQIPTIDIAFPVSIFFSIPATPNFLSNLILFFCVPIVNSILFLIFFYMGKFFIKNSPWDKYSAFKFFKEAIKTILKKENFFDFVMGENYEITIPHLLNCFIVANYILILFFSFLIESIVFISYVLNSVIPLLFLLLAMTIFLLFKFYVFIKNKVFKK